MGTISGKRGWGKRTNPRAHVRASSSLAGNRSVFFFMCQRQRLSLWRSVTLCDGQHSRPSSPRSMMAWLTSRERPRGVSGGGWHSRLFHLLAPAPAGSHLEAVQVCVEFPPGVLDIAHDPHHELLVQRHQRHKIDEHSIETVDSQNNDKIKGKIQGRGGKTSHGKKKGRKEMRCVGTQKGQQGDQGRRGVKGARRTQGRKKDQAWLRATSLPTPSLKLALTPT